MSCTPGRVVSKVRELNIPQETSMRSLILPRLRDWDSGIHDIFACGIWNPGNFELWNPEFWALKSGKQLKKSTLSR